MSILNNSLLLGADAAAGGYQISRSVRFNSSDSAYLGATFGTPTDQDVFTLSMWVKRSALGSTQHLFGVSTNHSFGFTSGDALNLTFGGSSALTTTALFRDPSAWYHIMWVQNGTAHTLYVNGTSAGTATATSNTFNTAVAHQISAGNTANFFNGYLAYVHFIDGQAKSPSAFGADDENGTWQPLVYAGGYGNNGFQLEMDDNSTAAALGTDTSGNSNTWTVNNISVTAGAGNDSLVDSPTNGSQEDTGVGGEVVGNYATLNPLASAGTFSNGNLEVSVGAAAETSGLATFGLPASSKWYWEVGITAIGSDSFVGISNGTSQTGLGSSYYYYRSIGGAFSGVPTPTSTPSPGATYTTGDIISIAYNADAATLTFYKNNVIQGTFTGVPVGNYFPFAYCYDNANRMSTSANAPSPTPPPAASRHSAPPTCPPAPSPLAAPLLAMQALMGPLCTSTVFLLP
jgi:hypothetical protein